jgi:hypothetical protein
MSTSQEVVKFALILGGEINALLTCEQFFQVAQRTDTWELSRKLI